METPEGDGPVGDGVAIDEGKGGDEISGALGVGECNFGQLLGLRRDKGFDAHFAEACDRSIFLWQVDFGRQVGLVCISYVSLCRRPQTLGRPGEMWTG